MAQLLILNEDHKSSITKLLTHAANNIVSLDQIKKMIAGTEKPVGEDPAFNLNFPGGMRVVYSIENQPYGLAKHISISYNNRLPAIPLVNYLIKFFGFKNQLPSKKTVVWMEGNAVNIIEQMAQVEPQSK